jgi:hypothetical protein
MDSDCEDVNLSWLQEPDCLESSHCDAGTDWQTIGHFVVSNVHARGNVQ